MITTTALEHLAIGAEPLEHLATRRDTAAAEPTPAGNPTTATGGTDAQILGHPSAKRRTAIPTREHHCGGSPIHNVPARRHQLERSPPQHLTNA